MKAECSHWPSSTRNMPNPARKSILCGASRMGARRNQRSNPTRRPRSRPRSVRCLIPRSRVIPTPTAGGLANRRRESLPGVMEPMAESPLSARASCHVLSGRAVADTILDQRCREVEELARSAAPPHLVSVTFGDPNAAEIYVRNQRRTAARVGIQFSEICVPKTASPGEALRTIEDLDADRSVTGIIIQRPVPIQLAVKVLQGAVSPDKAVEG